MPKPIDLLKILVVVLATQFVVETTGLILTDDRIADITKRIQNNHVESLPYGVLFKKAAVLDLSSSEWPHVIKVPQLPPMITVPTYRACARLPNIGSMVERHFSQDANETRQYIFHQFAIMKKALCQEWLNLAEDYNALIKQVTEDGTRQYDAMTRLVLPNKFSNDSVKKRQKRWDMSFMGEATGNFFGLATTSDIKVLKKAIVKITDHTKDLAEDFDVFKEDMVSVNTLQNTRISNLSKNLKQTMNTVNDAVRMTTTIHKLSRGEAVWEQRVHQLLIKTFSEVSVLMDAVLNYKQVIQDRTHAISWLNQHLLTPNMVTPSELKKALTGLEKYLLEHYPPFRFGFQSEEYFYRIPSTSYTADKDFLYIQIKIPLTVMAAHYHTYEVHSVPLVAADGTSQFTQIKNLPEYVAFSIQGDTYTTLPGAFIRNCEGIGVKRCPTRLLEVSTSVNSCILGLFLNDQNMTDKYCQVDLILTPNIDELALDIGDGKFFISNVDPGAEWVIACPQTRPRSVTPCRSCIISLQCRCTLKTSSAFISASLTGCKDMETSSGVTKSYVPNLMWMKYLANFTEQPQPAFNTSTLLDHDPLMDLPSVPVPSYLDVQDFVDTDQKVATSLDSVLQKVKRNKPIYVNKLQQLSSETKLMMLKNHYGVPLAAVAVTWNLIISGIVIFLFRKYRQLAVLLVYQAQQAEGATVYSQNPIKWGIVQYCLIYLVVAFTILVIARIVILINKWRNRLITQRKFYPPSSTTFVTTKVFIQLTSGNQAVCLFADEVKAPQHLLKIVLPDPMPDIPRFEYDSNWRRDILVMDWMDIHILHTQTKLTIPLPAAVESPRKIRFLVDSILRAPLYHLSVMLMTGIEQTKYPIGLVHNPHPFSFQHGRGFNRGRKAPPKPTRRGDSRPHPYKRQGPPRPPPPKFRKQARLQEDSVLYDKLDPVTLPKRFEFGPQPSGPFQLKAKMSESAIPVGEGKAEPIDLRPSMSKMRCSLMADMLERAEKSAYGASGSSQPAPSRTDSLSDDDLSTHMSDID